MLVDIKDLKNDEKGKLHEILLAKELSNNNEFPLHFREINSPLDVHNYIFSKIKPEEYYNITIHTNNTKNVLIDYLQKTEYIEDINDIDNIYWSSNPSDHEKITNVKDKNSVADIIISTKASGYICVSAKYGTFSSLNYKNDGLPALAEKARLSPNVYNDIDVNHRNNIETIGYSGLVKDRHAKYKIDKILLEKEKKEWINNNKNLDFFSPETEEARRAWQAEHASHKMKSLISEKHDEALIKFTEDDVKKYIINQVSPPTIFPHIVAHSFVDTKKNTYSYVYDAKYIAKDHLDKYYNIHVKKTPGIYTNFYGTDKETNTEKIIAKQGIKSQSGPCKNILGFFNLI